ncbi:hypothetical protein [Photobacterium lipolyticum]|uniref:Uncharacterized protein n=1 Tax=Photobacterium lipolyticum TaxID=266810 RepID=A0A2T3MV35_9GAMM|nr:hypothetical protein [Photobacterium lipolyticum]PSW03702.1 hypothetical protein C9I89_16335 [Photobacterium lipolyticum]
MSTSENPFGIKLVAKIKLQLKKVEKLAAMQLTDVVTIELNDDVKRTKPEWPLPVATPLFQLYEDIRQE